MKRRTSKTVAIPISAAERIAKEYGYDQVYIIGRKVGEGGREHLTTYGITREHCGVAARAATGLKRYMGWPEEDVKAVESAQSTGAP
jgi:hypothetical protein